CGECGNERIHWITAPNTISEKELEIMVLSAEKSRQKFQDESSSDEPYSAMEFPTTRRPVRRQLDESTPLHIVEKWFENSGIKIGSQAETPIQIEKAKRLLYTWRDVFSTDITNLKGT